MKKRSLLICALTCFAIATTCLVVALMGASSAADGKFDKKLGLTSPNGKIRFQCELNVDEIPTLNIYYLQDNDWIKAIEMPKFGFLESDTESLFYGSASKIAEIVGCSVPTIYRNLKQLRIHWEGHSKTGHWIIVK